MSAFAVPLLDLDLAWRTPAGAALVEATVEDQRGGHAEVVSVDGTDALVLAGPRPRVAALVASLLDTVLPLAHPRRARVYARGPRGWQPVREAPVVPALPDEDPDFEDPEP